MLVLVNLLCVAAMAWLGGLLARESGRHALWGLLFAAYFGLVVSVGRDTSEPLADACLLGGLLAYRHRRYVAAAALIAYAVFTNEPVLVLPVVLALTRLWQLYRRQARPGLPDLVWAAPGFLYLLLQDIQHVVVRGTAGGAADVSANLTWPFTALAAGLNRDVHRMSWIHLGTYDYNLIEFLALMAFVVAGFLVLRSTTAPIHERFAFFGFFVVEVVSASTQFWYSVFGEGRTYIDAYVMAVVLLLSTPAGTVTGAITRGAHRAHASLIDRLFAPRPRDHEQAPGLPSRRDSRCLDRSCPPPHPLRVTTPPFTRREPAPAGRPQPQEELRAFRRQGAAGAGRPQPQVTCAAPAGESRGRAGIPPGRSGLAL